MQRILSGLLVLGTVALHAAALSDQDVALCGNWQAEYIRTHQQIIQGHAPPRYAIAVSTYMGFADRLLGIIGVFLYALLTNRAFQISEGEHAHLMRLETVYAQPSLNWTATQDYGKYIRHSKGEGEAVSQTYRYIDALMAPVGDGLVEHLPWLGAHNAEALDMEEQHVIVLLNRGSTQQLFRNRYLEARLSELGLREDTAFGCAMEFLFRPLPEVEALMSREFGALSHSVSQTSWLPPPCPRANATARPGGDEAGLGSLLIRLRGEEPPRVIIREEVPERPTLVIGIQVRLVDAASASRLQSDEVASQFDLRQYFACAQQIEDEHRCDGQDVVWYLVSDTHHIRAKARELYREKVLTAVDAKLEHTSNEAGLEEAQALEGMRTAVGEHWAFGMTDYQVVTWNSGFGRTAAFRSKRTKFSLYTIGVPGSDAQGPIDCSREGHTTLHAASVHYSGI